MAGLEPTFQSKTIVASAFKKKKAYIILHKYMPTS
jgi:hypothetical protein